MSVFKFNVRAIQRIPERETLPIFDFDGPLAGGFCSFTDNLLKCFVGNTSYPTALQVSSGGEFYFTTFSTEGIVSHAVVSTHKLNERSIKVTAAEEA